MLHSTGTCMLALTDSSLSSPPKTGVPETDSNNTSSTTRTASSTSNATTTNTLSQYVRNHRVTLLVSALVFGVVCGAGLLLVNRYAESYRREARDNAFDMATETGTYFKIALDQAMLPLFSLAQFATEIPEFHQLPYEIGPAAASNGSLPLLLEKVDSFVHRNMSSSGCADPATVERFNQIAATIKRNANMPGILVQLAMMPAAVMCFNYPLVNQDDFPNGPPLNATRVIGMDFLSDPKLKRGAESTLMQNGLVIVGPSPRTGCSERICATIMERQFSARYPIMAPDHRIRIQGEEYNRWGFVGIIINFDALVEQSGVHEKFRKSGQEFILTRTDSAYGKKEEIVVLAESENYAAASSDSHEFVHADIGTVNKEWQMHVKYSTRDQLGWRNWVVPLVVFASAAVAYLIYTVLVQKHTHADMVGKTRAQRACIETERNMTAYFAPELRNPLGAIDSALAAMPDNQPPENEEFLKSMKLCAGFMSSVMNNLLDVRQMEEGILTLHRNPLNLETLLSELHAMLSTSVNEGVDFRWEVRTLGRNWVLGDTHRIQQVVTNVVSNAMKYTISGSITISLQWNELGRLHFECRDTGPGIPKEEQAQLFQRFVRRGGAPGTGLAIAKQIVDSMKGSIHFESDPTVAPGTACIVVFPLEECDAPETNPKKRGDPSTPIEEEISFLVVDDIRMNRMMLKRRFQKCIAPNSRIVEACTGEEALEICQRKGFDVIIMDQYMEEAGGTLLGTDTIIAMKRMGISSGFIGCSGNDMGEEFKSAGAEFVWKKPLPPNAEIIGQLRNSIPRRRTSL